MFEVGVDSNTESLFGAFHKIATATTMNVDFDATRHDIVAASIVGGVCILFDTTVVSDFFSNVCILI